MSFEVISKYPPTIVHKCCAQIAVFPLERGTLCPSTKSNGGEGTLDTIIINSLNHRAHDYDTTCHPFSWIENNFELSLDVSVSTMQYSLGLISQLWSAIFDIFLNIGHEIWGS